MKTNIAYCSPECIEVSWDLIWSPFLKTIRNLAVSFCINCRLPRFPAISGWPNRRAYKQKMAQNKINKSFLREFQLEINWEITVCKEKSNELYKMNELLSGQWLRVELQIQASFSLISSTGLFRMLQLPGGALHVVVTFLTFSLLIMFFLAKPKIQFGSGSHVFVNVRFGPHQSHWRNHYDG